MSNPGVEVEALASFDEDTRALGGTAVHQAGQDESPQARQGELAEDVDLGGGRFDERHLVFHERGPYADAWRRGDSTDRAFRLATARFSLRFKIWSVVQAVPCPQGALPRLGGSGGRARGSQRAVAMR